MHSLGVYIRKANQGMQQSEEVAQLTQMESVLDDYGANPHGNAVPQQAAPCLTGAGPAAANADAPPCWERASADAAQQSTEPHVGRGIATEPNALQPGKVSHLQLEGSTRIVSSPSTALGPLLDRALKKLKGKESVQTNEGFGNQNLEAALVDTPPPLVRPNQADVTPKRRSKRREASVDEDSLERAQRLVATKNLEDSEGYLQRDTLDQVLDVTAKGGHTSSQIGMSCA